MPGRAAMGRTGSVPRNNGRSPRLVLPLELPRRWAMSDGALEPSENNSRTWTPRKSVMPHRRYGRLFVLTRFR
jgi:hypothetical protein